MMHFLSSCLILSIFLMVMVSSPCGWASPPPLPPKKKEVLSSIDQQMEDEKSEQKELAKQAKDLEEDLSGLKKNLISIASKIQSYETTIQELEYQLLQLKKEKADITNSLGKQRESIADLVIALERIRRIPPEALIARPDAPLETAQAATVLGAILPELDRRAKKLKLDLDDLQIIEDDLVSKQIDLKETNEKLLSDQVQLDKLLDKRSNSLKKTKEKVQEKDAAIAQLSKSAKDLADLIDKVEKKNRDLERRTGNIPQKSGEPNRSISLTDLPALGNSRLPVSGVIKTRYGGTDEIGALSKGLTIEARPSSIVVAPLGGVVRYAGPFKKYGSIILLEHKNKFHSLVAGLGKIDTFVGQSVDAGEPLGRLPDYTGRLYYELRYRGAPVNPEKKHAKLN